MKSEALLKTSILLVFLYDFYPIAIIEFKLLHGYNLFIIVY
jgi:hypothetical protein